MTAHRAYNLNHFDDNGPLEGNNLLGQGGYDLTGDLILPVLLTWPSSSRLVVVGKEDVFQTEAHLRVFEQTRNNLSNQIGVEPVTSTTTGFEHTKADLVRDAGLPEQYMCWTRKTTTAGSDDAWSKPKDASTWLGSTDRAISSSADVEDHCMLAVNSAGALYSVYHHNQSSGDDIWLRVSTWNGTTWSVSDINPLGDSAGANFPTIWSVAGAVGGTSKVVIAATSLAGNFLYWSCTGSTANCLTADFGNSDEHYTTNGLHKEPKVFAVIRPGTVTRDVFIAYENAHVIHLVSKCGDGATYTDWGPLPLPTGYNVNTTETQFGATAAPWSGFSSARAVDGDGSEFNIAFLATDQTTSTSWDVMRYHAAATDFCP